MNQEYMKEYYNLQCEAFTNHVKAIIDTMEKVLALEDNQASEQQRAAVRGVKAIYTGKLVEDIKSDLSSGHVTMETVEKRVQLDVDTCKAVIDLLNPTPMGKILLELILVEQVNAMRTNLKNQVMWVNMQNKQQ